MKRDTFEFIRALEGSIEPYDLILDGIKLHDFSALCHGTDKSNVTHSENKGA